MKPKVKKIKGWGIFLDGKIYDNGCYYSIGLTKRQIKREIEKGYEEEKMKIVPVTITYKIPKQ